MPARESAPKKDHTEQPLFPATTSATPMHDGMDSKQWNINTGRSPGATTQGGPAAPQGPRRPSVYVK